MPIVSQLVWQQYDHVIGVDTHARTHTLAVLSSAGALLKSATFPTSKPGLDRAYAWMLREAPGHTLVAMEGTGSYGATFTDLLSAHRVEVTETKPPKRGVRRAGKSDVIDAEHAARHALALPVDRLMIPRTHHGDQAALRVLLTSRKALQKNKTATSNALTALLRGFPLGIDARKKLTKAQIGQVAAWRTRSTDTPAQNTIRAEATRMAQEIHTRQGEIATINAKLTIHVTALAAWLLEENGLGPFTAAQLLVSFSAHGRIRSEAAFARLAGVAPIPASSGNTTRHRLHRGGDRQLNHALYIIASHRMLNDEPTKAYTAKRQEQGHNRRETLRNLKRHIARSIFRKLNANT
ncbi:IS110 family RNA-guided transposase [Rathayibacter soli]|uniref:IS110 family transposase n=1 Tax=Rathayibacter soli TaxID=3144168 RepID=UPI0027E5091C|nr:IS110 family transposase [Glaciibacter superstes]